MTHSQTGPLAGQESPSADGGLTGSAQLAEHAVPIEAPEAAAALPAVGAGQSRDDKRSPAAIGRRLAPPLGSLVVVLGIWQLIGSHTDPILFSTPLNTVKSFGTIVKDGELLPAFVVSMKDLWTGYFLAVLVGLIIGVVLGRSPRIAKIVNPYINFMQATPLIALVPLIVIWFGVGFHARVAVVFLFSLFSVIINTSVGVSQTPRILVDVGRVYHLTRFQVVRHIALPNAVPSIFAGLRLGLGKGLIGMIIAEMFVSLNGLGGLVTSYGNAFATGSLLAAIFTASLVGVIAAGLLELVERFAFKWTTLERSS